MKKVVLEIRSGIPKDLKVNRSRYTHKGATAGAKNELQRLVYLEAYDFKDKFEDETGERWKPLEKGTISYTLVILNRRFIQDDDNVITAFKGLRDELQCEKKGTIAGCGIITTDKHFRTGDIKWEVDAKRAPMIIITVEGE